MLRASPLLVLGLVAATVFGDPAKALRSHQVGPGDTLINIARRYRVSVSALRRANALRSDRIRQGTTLRIPGRRASRARARSAGHHIVQRGQTLSHIARRYRTSVRALRRANRLRSDRIRAGQRLRIPGRRRENRLPRLPTREPRPDQAEAQADAQTLGLGSTRVAQAILNDGVEPRWIEAAARAPEAIPAHAYGRRTSVTGETSPRREDAAAQGLVGALVASTRDDDNDDSTDADSEEDVVMEESSSDAGDPGPEPPDGPGTLRVPIDTAYYMRGWGSGRGGYHLAVDMGSPRNTPITASQRGIVAYAGHGVRGYGRFVIIVHPEGYATAYAHNRELLVVPGERVARGQVIALLGNTGLSRGPHLHFMLVHEGEHCDPLPLFRPRIRYRTGQVVPTGIAEWSEERPEVVRCLPRSARPYRRRRR